MNVLVTVTGFVKVAFVTAPEAFDVFVPGSTSVLMKYLVSFVSFSSMGIAPPREEAPRTQMAARTPTNVFLAVMTYP
jgi:hypothetical protein